MYSFKFLFLSCKSPISSVVTYPALLLITSGILFTIVAQVSLTVSGLATVIVKKLCEDLLLENKICYLMVLEKNVERLYEKIGFYRKSTYGKLIRR